MMLVKGGAVARQSAFVFDTALDVVEHDLGKLALGQAVQVFDIDGVFGSHLSGARKSTVYLDSMAYSARPRQSFQGAATVMPSARALAIIRSSNATNTASSRRAMAM